MVAQLTSNVKRWTNSNQQKVPYSAGLYFLFLHPYRNRATAPVPASSAAGIESVCAVRSVCACLCGGRQAEHLLVGRGMDWEVGALIVVAISLSFLCSVQNIVIFKNFDRLKLKFFKNNML